MFSMADEPERIFLGLGSNLGNRKENIRQALRLLEQWAVKIRSLSSFYIAEPVDFPAQPWFINAAAEIETPLTPGDLLASCLQVESSLKRKRIIPKGPRTIDIDILLFGQRIINQQALTIPHPRLLERKFMLIPLAEIAPSAIYPIGQTTILELTRNLKSHNKVFMCGLKQSFRAGGK